MTKKRIAVLAIFSPIILGLLAFLVLVSLVLYAINGKWELKHLLGR